MNFQEPSEPSRGAIRPSTPWWVWALAILLTAAVVFGLLDALNTPEPGGVNFPYPPQ